MHKLADNENEQRQRINQYAVPNQVKQPFSIQVFSHSTSRRLPPAKQQQQQANSQPFNSMHFYLLKKV